MKLRMKLIPVCSLAVTAAALLPLNLTSCSSEKYIGKGFDLVENFYPKVERFEPEEGKAYSIKEIHDIYMEQLNKDLSTFVQDYMWSKSWIGTAFEQYLFWQKLLIDESTSINPANTSDREIAGPASDYYDKDVEVISNLSMETETVEEECTWKGWVVPRLSFTLSFQSVVKEQVIQSQYYPELTGYINGVVNGEISFYNVPFYCIMRNVETIDTHAIYRIVSFEPFYELMSKFRKQEPYWQIQTSIYSSLAGEIEIGPGVVERVADDWQINVIADTEKPEWIYDNLSLSRTIGSVFTTSYYLMQIKPVGMED